MISYDIAIIGAGVSGLVAAVNCEKIGLNAVLIDENKKAETSTKLKIDVTEELKGLKDIINELELPVNGISNMSIWSTQKNSFRLTSKIRDFYFVRGQETDSFETLLKKRLDSFKVSTLYKSKVIYLEETEDNVKIKIDLNGEENTITSKYVVITGDSSEYIPENLKPKITKKFNIFGYSIKEKLLEKGTTYIFFDKKNIGEGYVYATSLDNLSSIAIVLDNSDSVNLSKKLEECIKSNKIVDTSNFKNFTVFEGTYSTSILKKYSTDRIYLAGDSAYLPDFFIGYGLGPAIISGYYATKTIKEKINGKVTDYDKLMKRSNKERLYTSLISWQIFKYLNNKDLTTILEILNFLEKKVGVDKFFESPLRYKEYLLKILFWDFILTLKITVLFILAKLKQYTLFKLC